MSSVLIAEGRPDYLMGLLNDTTDLWEAIVQTNRFVVHLLPEDERVVAERFAGLRPSPGGLFVGLEVHDSEHGPALTAFPNRAYCTFEDAEGSGFQQLVRGRIDDVELSDLERPLVHFRGRFRRLIADR